MYSVFKFACLALLVFSAFRVSSQRDPVDFQYYQGLIFLDVIYGSDTLLALFDTGAEASAIDAATSDQFKLPIFDSTLVSGASNSMRVARVGMAGLRLGSFQTDEIFPTKRDLGHSLVPSNRRLDLILGYDFFKDQIVSLDFVKKQLRLLTNTYPCSCDESIPFTLDHNIPRFKGKVGSVHLQFRLDTGASLFETEDIYINITSADWLRLRAKYPGLEVEKYFSATGLDNTEVKLAVARLNSCELDNLIIESPYVIVQPERGYFAQAEAVGFVSNNFLSKFSLVAIDYIHHRLCYRW